MEKNAPPVGDHERSLKHLKDGLKSTAGQITEPWLRSRLVKLESYAKSSIPTNVYSLIVLIANNKNRASGTAPRFKGIMGSIILQSAVVLHQRKHTSTRAVC